MSLEQFHLSESKIYSYGKSNLSYATDIKSLNDIKLGQDIISLWVQPQFHKDILEDKLTEINFLLSKGVSIFFIEPIDSNIILKAFNQNSEQIEDYGNTQLKYIIVTQNEIGEKFIHWHYFTETFANSDVTNHMIASVWNRRNDLKYTQIQNTSYTTTDSYRKFQTSNWVDLTSWNRAVYTCDGGILVEWYKYLFTRAPEGEMWTMLAEMTMEPNTQDGMLYKSALLEFESNNDWNNILFYDEPRAKPSSQTWSIGANFGYDAASVAATWNIVLEDVTFNNLSTGDPDTFKKVWDYNYYSSYATQRSDQCSYFVRLSDSFAPSAVLDCDYKAEFCRMDWLGRWFFKYCTGGRARLLYNPIYN